MYNIFGVIHDEKKNVCFFNQEAYDGGQNLQEYFQIIKQNYPQNRLFDCLAETGLWSFIPEPQRKTISGQSPGLFVLIYLCL